MRTTLAQIACASAQSDQRLYFLLPVLADPEISRLQLLSVAEQARLTEDRFFRDVARL